MLDYLLPADEADRLATLRSLHLTEAPPDARLDRIVRLLARTLGVPIAYVSLVDAEVVWIKSAVGLDVPCLGRATSVCARTILGEGAMAIPDFREHPAFNEHPLVTGPAGLRSYAGCPLRAANGQPLGTLSVIDVAPRDFTPTELADLTDFATMAETELARGTMDTLIAQIEAGQVALRERELRQGKLLEATFGGILVTEAGVIIEANQAAADLLRAAGPADLLGLSAAEITAPEARAEVLSRMAQGDETPYETIALRRDGSRAEVEVVGRSYAVGERQLRVTALRDIGDRRRLERQKEQFVAVVSHDLKNPLGAITLSLGALVDDVVPTLDLAPAAAEELGYWLGMGRKAIARLVRLTGDLLDDERLRSGAVPLRLRPCTSAAILEEAAWTMRGEADQAEVEIALEGDPVRFRADHDRMLQLVVNLLGNAVKFSPRGSRVVLRAEALVDRMRLVVEDQGRGIPADKLVSVFERFEQVELDDAAMKGGTGLGLSICRAIAEQHGGRIWAENRPTGGTRFTAELPLA